MAVLWPAFLGLRSYLRDAPPNDRDVYLVRRHRKWSFTSERSEADAADEVFVIAIRPLADEEIHRLTSDPKFGVFSYRHCCEGKNPIHLHSGHAESVLARTMFGPDPTEDRETLRWVRSELAFDDASESRNPAEESIGRGILSCLRLYLPIILGAAAARRERRAFITAHLAQSLDGRIACLNGHSQWISGDADLRHAHRLRALHDGVLVGGGTVLRDDPQLTVRHVEGDDPVRIILNASANVMSSEKPLQIMQGQRSLLLCGREAHDRMPQGVSDQVSSIPFDVCENSTIDPSEIRRTLFERGIHSIFVEGGAGAFSSFLHSGCIDILHLAIAPLILGSGIPSISLPEVTRVQQGQRLRTTPFYLDQDLLIECRLADGADKDRS